MIQEDKTFTFRFSLEARFPDDYEGEEDNYHWVEEWERLIKPELLKVMFESLRRHPAWAAHVRNRGISPLDEIEIAMTRDLSKNSLGLS